MVIAPKDLEGKALLVGPGVQVDETQFTTVVTKEPEQKGRALVRVLVRHGIAALGMYLVTKQGWGADAATGVTALFDVESIVGGVMTAGAAVWSWVEKVRK